MPEVRVAATRMAESPDAIVVFMRSKRTGPKWATELTSELMHARTVPEERLAVDAILTRIAVELLAMAPHAQSRRIGAWAARRKFPSSA